MKKKVMVGVFSLVSALALVGCSSTDENVNSNKEEKRNDVVTQNGNEYVNQSGSWEIPEGLKTAENPKFGVGSKAIIKGAHMGGMKGVEATVVGVFDTTVYAISYLPTLGGEKVENHKWIVHEEIKDAGEKPYEVGEEVVVNTAHMEGMKGVTAKIDSAERMNVYVVDYTLPATGEKVTNHMWVVENELQTIKELVSEYSGNTLVDKSASITSKQLIVTDSDKKQITYDLPEDEFFVSIAPYVETTHPCATHSLTGCQGELKNEEFKVHIKDSEGNVVVDQTMKSQANGFIDLWLPRNKTFNVVIEHGEKKAESKIGTFEEDDTCVSTMQLK